MLEMERPTSYVKSKERIGSPILPIVITDADATLLDHHTYSFEPAVPALARLHESGYPLIIATSKTIPEVVHLQEKLGILEPFVYENGAGIAIPSGHFNNEVIADTARQEGVQVQVLPDGGAVVPIAASIEEVRSRLHSAVAAAEVNIVGFEQWHLHPQDMIAACNFVDEPGQTAMDKAVAALERRAQEGFVFLDDSGYESEQAAWEALSMQMSAQGLTVSRGGRFYQASMGSDKGRAVELLLGMYGSQFPTVTTVPIGLGDSQNDVPLLQACIAAGGRGFLVANPAQAKQVQISGDSGIVRLSQIGPEGWNYAVQSTLDELAR